MHSGTTAIELSARGLAGGEVVAGIEGELDIVTAGAAVRYVQEIIDAHHGPVIANLAGVRFCDAAGLRALVRMANHAERAGRAFRVAAPSPRLVRLLRITGLHDRLVDPPGSSPVPGQREGL